MEMNDLIDYLLSLPIAEDFFWTIADVENLVEYVEEEMLYAGDDWSSDGIMYIDGMEIALELGLDIDRWKENQNNFEVFFQKIISFIVQKGMSLD